MARILVVDDEAFVRMYLEEVLCDEGHEVRSARDGREALEALREGPVPDVILLDLMMPGMNGWEFRRAQMQDPHISEIPVVVVSGAGDVHAEARQLGARAALTKPFRSGQLLATLADAGVWSAA
jgi:CheY-like chemotaxis protein